MSARVGIRGNQFMPQNRIGAGGRLLTAAEAAHYLAVPFAAFINWHEIPGAAPRHLHAANRIRYRIADLDGWLLGDVSCFEACHQCASELEDGSFVDGGGGPRDYVRDEAEELAALEQPQVDGAGLETQADLDLVQRVQVRPPLTA